MGVSELYFAGFNRLLGEPLEDRGIDVASQDDAVDEELCLEQMATEVQEGAGLVDLSEEQQHEDGVGDEQYSEEDEPAENEQAYLSAVWHVDLVGHEVRGCDHHEADDLLKRPHTTKTRTTAESTLASDRPKSSSKGAQVM